MWKVVDGTSTFKYYMSKQLNDLINHHTNTQIYTQAHTCDHIKIEWIKVNEHTHMRWLC